MENGPTLQWSYIQNCRQSQRHHCVTQSEQYVSGPYMIHELDKQTIDTLLSCETMKIIRGKLSQCSKMC